MGRFSEQISYEHLFTGPFNERNPYALLEKKHVLDSERLDRLTRANEPEIMDDSEFREQSLHQEQFVHDGINVDFSGVTHVPETLLFHRDALRKSIAQSKVLIVEGAPITQGIGDASTIMEISKLLYAAGIHKQDKTVEDTVNRVESNYWSDFDSFFCEIERMAWLEKKPIILTDPLFNTRRLVDDYCAFFQFSGESTANRLDKETAKRIEKISSPAFTGLVMYLLARMTVSHVGAGALETGASNNDPKKLFSRRSFLRLLGGGVAAASLSPMERMHSLAEFLTRDSAAGELFTYNAVVDYRNAMIAEGIDQTIKILKSERKIDTGDAVAIIYGGAHRVGIHKFLEQPQLRKLKIALYKPYNEFFGNLDITEHWVDIVPRPDSKREFTIQKHERVLAPLYRKEE